MDTTDTFDYDLEEIRETIVSTRLMRVRYWCA